jgi:hypothetical protein
MSMTIMLNRSTACLLIAALVGAGVGACSASHGDPQAGTETGNPPVIDVARVTLLVSEAEAKITGSAGAVTPGGGQLTVLSSLTGKSYQASVAKDGSFAITISGSPEDIFELRAADESGDSSEANPVYVARGSAAVSGGAEGLSCKQREDLARAQMNAVVAAADGSCTVDADCQLQGYGTVCSDACSDAPVSAQGAGQIEQARSAIAQGICRDFSARGCSFLALPCVPPVPGNPRCLANKCTLGSGN